MEFSKKVIKNIVRRYNRIRLKNSNFTIIANTCVGGLMSHELNQRFCSPMVNLAIYNHDEFFPFVEHLDYYLELPIEFVPSNYHFPVGILHGEYGNVEIYFVHYTSEDQALNKWRERIPRINRDNMFLIMDGDNCSDEQVEKFSRLPIDNKVIFTMKPYPEIPSVFPITHPQFTQGSLLKNGLKDGALRWFEVFDYVHFFNTGEIRENALFRNKKKN